MCNLAITRRATVTLGIDTNQRGAESSAQHGSPDSSASPGSHPLVAAALRWHGFKPAHLHYLHLHNDFPTGAGLGGSSAAGVALAAAIARVQQRHPTPSELAQQSRAVEVEVMGIAGGFQDHYAAAFGGALGLSFGHGNNAVNVERLPLDSSLVARLEARTTLVHTGESRISGETITAVLDAYREGDRRVAAALDRLRDLAIEMRNAIISADTGTLAALTEEHWHSQRSLHPAITTARIDALHEQTRKVGATGFKALGASGGGCVLIWSEPENTQRVRQAAAKLGELLDWHAETKGVEVADSGVSSPPHDSTLHQRQRKDTL